MASGIHWYPVDFPDICQILVTSFKGQWVNSWQRCIVYWVVKWTIKSWIIAAAYIQTQKAPLTDLTSQQDGE